MCKLKKNIVPYILAANSHPRLLLSHLYSSIRELHPPIHAAAKPFLNMLGVESKGKRVNKNLKAVSKNSLRKKVNKDLRGEGKVEEVNL